MSAVPRATARDAVLGRIRTALGPDRSVPADAVRDYRLTDDRPLPELLDLLVDRIEDYRATVLRCAPDQVATTVHHALADALGQHAAVTGIAVAIAETGTLVLGGSPASGRRALSLLPDCLVCVLTPDLVVGNVPEALAPLDPLRPLTMISGPSATSDIELQRVEGVHGPRTLLVVLTG